MRGLIAALMIAGAPLWAQTAGSAPGEDAPLPEFDLQVDDLIDGGILVEELDVGPGSVETLTPGGSRVDSTVRVATAPGAILRGLDKVSGEVVDMTLAAGGSARLGRITVELLECRYPVDNPNGDAFAYLTIRAEGLDRPAFEGWMVASSPALSALEHPRYDVWVIRCNNV